MKHKKQEVSRRKFITTSAISATGFTLLSSMSKCSDENKKVKEESPKKDSDKEIRLGFVGLGRQAMYLMGSFIKLENVKIVACSDVYGRKRTRCERRVKGYSEKHGIKNSIVSYEDYNDLLANKDVDAVVIATPDHTHAMIAVAACKAGKDVYLEKPMTFTIKEGQILRKTVRETDRILAIGSQQRSDPNFQHAVKMVQSGKIGKITKVNAYVGVPPKPYDLPPVTVPEDLNWDLWLGPLSETIHYNPKLNPTITLDPIVNETNWGAWRWYKEMGGGFTTDWGAHMFDIAQWGLGKDGSGPVEISPIDDGSEFMSFTYDNGVIMTSEPFNNAKTKGVKFWGDKGWIEVSRNHYLSSDSSLDPKKKEIDSNVPYEENSEHHLNFIESVRKHVDPIVPVEIGHSSCTICTLGNIACDLKKTIKWNPNTETFVDDNEGMATAKMHYNYRKGWKLV